MKVLVAGLVALTAAATLATPVGAMPNTACTLSTPVQEVTSMTQLPSALRNALPPIAEIGVPFNSTDSVLDPSLPFRRLIRAGQQDNDWFVWYEHGGLVYYWQMVVARVDGDRMSTLANAGTVTDALCAVTDGALARRVPPYPNGAWAASSF